MTNINLFTTIAERARLRLEDVLANRDCRWPASYDERQMLVLLSCRQGRHKAIALGEVCDRLKLSPRAVKDIVQNLRINFNIQICASRDGTAGGYYLAATAEEIEESISQMWHQAITMLQVCRAMRGPQHDIAELLGQIRIHLEKESASA